MAAFKVTDLFLGEKNFIDFVDKNLGQERDRLQNDELETDIVCSHLAGGILDYPRMISHDFADITTAIDIYMDAFMREARSKIPQPYAYGVFKKDNTKNDRIGKMPFRGDELTVKQFINAIISACPKMRNHIVDCWDEATNTGRLENLYVIISNVVMIRNYIWVFLEVLEADNKAKLKAEYKEFCNLTEVLSEQMLQIFGNLLTTFLLHDEQSQCFSNHQAYFEGERGSPIIPMWAYFLKGMQRDMWSLMPPQLAQRILAIIVNDSLAIIGARYTKIRPTDATTLQYVVDILNVLIVVEELLFYISPDLASVCGQMDPSNSKILFSIHMKCHCLVSSLLIVGCPLEVLYKNFRRGLSSCSLMDTRSKSQTHLTEPSWMSAISLLCPKFYPSDMEYSDWNLLYNLKLLLSLPSINWPLVYKVLTMDDCKIGTFVLTLFTKVCAPVGHFLLEGHGFSRCKCGCLSYTTTFTKLIQRIPFQNASCMDPDCHGLPKVLPNHLASACTSYIIGNAMAWDMLPHVYRPVLSMIDNWSVMDKTQIWNSKVRPVWFQSLVDILLPVLKTCVQSLILTISESVNKPLESAELVQSHPTAAIKPNISDASSSKPQPTLRRGSVSVALNVDLEREEELLTQWVIELLNFVTEVLSIIPRGFFMVCEEMDDLIPRKFIPVRNNVPVHFLVTALYMLLNLGTGIITSIIEEVTLPNHETKDLPSKDAKKNRTANKKQPSPVPSVASHLEPCLLSTAEKLCYLDDPVFDQVVHRLVTQMESMMKHTKANHDKSTVSSDIMTDFSMECDISHLKADFLMENVEGQISLRVMYWFILSHGSMLQTFITGAGHHHKGRTKSGKMHPPDKSKDNIPYVPNSKSMSQAIKLNMNVLKIVPRIRTNFTPVNIIHDFHYVNKYRTFDEILWDATNLDWVQTIRQCQLGLQKAVIAKMLEKRWEFRQSTEEEILNSTDEKSIHLLKMVNDIKALVLQ